MEITIMNELSEMEKQILRYAAGGTIVLQTELSQHLFAPWHSIEYALNKLIAAGLLQQDFTFAYSLTSEGRKIADILREEGNGDE